MGSRLASVDPDGVCGAERAVLLPPPPPATGVAQMRNEYIADVCCDVPSMTVEKSSGGRWDSDRSAGRRCATGLGLPVIPLVIRKNIVPHLCDSRSPQGEGESFLPCRYV